MATNTKLFYGWFFKWKYDKINIHENYENLKTMPGNLWTVIGWVLYVPVCKLSGQCWTLITLLIFTLNQAYSRQLQKIIQVLWYVEASIIAQTSAYEARDRKRTIPCTLKTSEMPWYYKKVLLENHFFFCLRLNFLNIMLGIMLRFS